MHLRAISASLGLGLLLSCASAADPEPSAISAPDLAARMSAKQQSGSSNIRAKMENSGGSSLQLQIKSRSGPGGRDLVCQVLWPKERKGEAVLLRSSGRGAVFTPPDSVRPIGPGQMREPLFGSALSYEDVIENHFAWDQQAIVGTEVVDRVQCSILESKPAKGRSVYSSVRTWIDPRRLVPMRIEKYGAPGKVIRRIDTTRVAADDRGRAVPANLTIRGPGGTVTEIDGSRIKHGVSFADEEFTPEGLSRGVASAGPE